MNFNFNTRNNNTATTASSVLISSPSSQVALALRGPQTDAAFRLAAREWRGLAYDTPKEEASHVGIVEGRVGRASGYQGEGGV